MHKIKNCEINEVAITDIEIFLVLDNGEKELIDLSGEDVKKIMFSLINNFFKGEIPFIES